MALILRAFCKPQICLCSGFAKQRNIHITRYLKQEKKIVLPRRKVGRFTVFKPMSWTTFTISTILGCIFCGYIYYLKEQKDLLMARERRRTMGKMNIGGKFELVNSKGELVKSDDFLGQWALIYFGFTHCPDICPDEVEKMVNTVEKLEKKYNFKVQPIFISVDPDRDTPAAVGKYCAEFSDKIIGLTGTREQVAKACKSYRVYFSNGPKDTDNDYIVDHTIIMYLIDPDGHFVDYYGQSNTVDQVMGSIVVHQGKLAKLKGETGWWPKLNINTDESVA